jgi:hypothetical protein
VTPRTSGSSKSVWTQEARAGQGLAVALDDSGALREIIQSSHPGAIDDKNPEFQHWAQMGYEQSSKLIARVADYNSAMASVRNYVTGFRDGHFVYSDDACKANFR